MQEKVQFICVYQKNVVILQQISRKYGSAPKKFPVFGSKTYRLWQSTTFGIGKNWEQHGKEPGCIMSH